jgi:hypothetical protein
MLQCGRNGCLDVVTRFRTTNSVVVWQEELQQCYLHYRTLDSTYGRKAGCYCVYASSLLQVLRDNKRPIQVFRVLLRTLPHCQYCVDVKVVIIVGKSSDTFMVHPQEHTSMSVTSKNKKYYPGDPR